jgi:hypothetical protein
MNPVNLIIVLLIFAGIIWLQIFLSKKENKWFGLILPIIAICISILPLFVTPIDVTHQSGNGNNIITNVPQGQLPSTGATIFTGFDLFVLFNIPTAVFLIIYIICRVKRKKKMEMKKMNIQDL